MQHTTGAFTLPGEAGYETLALQLAETWGADVIRDSDGTELSETLAKSGLGIYSILCIIRNHNEWLRRHPHCRQQTFLITAPRTATNEGPLDIPLLEDFFTQHVQVNEQAESRALWQVYDRTAGRLLPLGEWAYEAGRVRVAAPVPWHSYTVSFLAWRIWEEISMYNHTTNHWDAEHLMQLDPIHPEARAYLLDWLEDWCRKRPDTTVVRFTSLFYNFAWIWGSNERNRSLFTDWGAYTFTASPLALAQFEQRYGYALTAEDFVCGGKYRTTHLPPDARLLDWMDFISGFVADFGRELVEVVHRHGKKAYVFYDDSWVGLEPYGPHFSRIGFDGIIKCVFSGFEARLCAGVKAETHELRLHPYLFPVGLGGAPTFSPGGDPARDAHEYWVAVRRALLRAPVERIGLGGYLHLVQDRPDFVDGIAEIADSFRAILALHQAGAPAVLPPVVGVVTAWGRLRSWTCCGHLHENPWNDLINLLESLSGLPFEVEFFSLEDLLRDGVPPQVDVLLNAGFAGSAWSGGDIWREDRLVALLGEWVHGGGCLLGVGAPSAVPGYDRLFRMAHVLGVDLDTGARANHGRWRFTADGEGLLPEGCALAPLDGVYLADGETRVLAAEGEKPLLTRRRFGKGMGLYLSSYRHTPPNARLLQNLLLHAAGGPPPYYTPDDPMVECAWFPASGTLAVVNNSAAARMASVSLPGGESRAVPLAPYETRLL